MNNLTHLCTNFVLVWENNQVFLKALLTLNTRFRINEAFQARDASKFIKCHFYFLFQDYSLFLNKITNFHFTLLIPHRIQLIIKSSEKSDNDLTKLYKNRKTKQINKKTELVWGEGKLILLRLTNVPEILGAGGHWFTVLRNWIFGLYFVQIIKV